MPTQRRTHPADDTQFVTVVWRDIPLKLKKKFPMFGFMRTITKDPIEGIAMILSEESLAALEEIDMDFADLNNLIETISDGLGAKTAGN